MTNQREILFRGFHPCADGDTTIYVEGEAVNGRWVEGDLVHSKSGFVFVKDPTNCEYGLWENGHYCGNHIVDKVLPSTVCQYTGLTDKNGRKIFEGDKVICPYLDPIFKTPWDNNGVKCLNNVPLPVIYQSGTFCIDYRPEEKGIMALNAFCIENDIEVIGTIWDKEEA